MKHPQTPAQVAILPAGSHVADATFRPGEDNVPADSVGDLIPFTPDELNNAERYDEDTDKPVKVTIVDRYVPTTPRGAHDWSVNQIPVGGQGQQSTVPMIVGADPARRSVTITNIGPVPIGIGPSQNISPSSCFILTNGATDILAGASITIPFRGAIYACLITGTTAGLIQFSATAEDG